MTVLTTIPVENTCGIRNYYPIPLDCIQEQLEAIFDDIKPDAIKIGVLFSIENIELVASFLKDNALGIPLILDPVMVGKNGSDLLQKEAISCLKKTAYTLL